MWRSRLVPAVAGVLAIGAGGCAAQAGDDGDGLRVVAAFYPLEFLADQVGGEHVSVTALAPPGVEAHDLELTPGQVADVSQADLVIYLSGFQPAVDQAVAEYAGDRGFDVASLVPLLDATADDGHGHGEDGDAGHTDEDGHAENDEHTDEGGHAEEDEHTDEDGHADEDEHGPAEPDPHLWLDPDRLATVAGALADRLGELDDDHAADYTGAAETLRTDLAALDREYADGLADCQRREIVVSHAAFGYLADRYDLDQIAVTGLSPEDEPSPQRLAEVIHEAERHGATTIFFEVLVSPAVAEVIADQVGAETAVLDPIEGIAPDRDEDYLSVMRTNLATLRGALECR